jgi:hypothetical protein
MAAISSFDDYDADRVRQALARADREFDAAKAAGDLVEMEHHGFVISALVRRLRDLGEDVPGQGMKPVWEPGARP